MGAFLCNSRLFRVILYKSQNYGLILFVFDKIQKSVEILNFKLLIIQNFFELLTPRSQFSKCIFQYNS